MASLQKILLMLCWREQEKEGDDASHLFSKNEGKF